MEWEAAHSLSRPVHTGVPRTVLSPPMVREQKAAKASAGKLHKAIAEKWLFTVTSHSDEWLNYVVSLC